VTNLTPCGTPTVVQRARSLPQTRGRDSAQSTTATPWREA